MLTSPGFSSGIQQRQSAGWGQGFAFPGPPRMTIESPQDQARESNITVEGARINLPSIPTPNISINSNPTYSSPVYDFSSNYGSPLNLAFENQMNLQQVQQDLQTYVFSNNLEGRIAALESWKATGAVACGTQDIAVMEDWYYDPTEDPNNILKQRFRIRIQDGLITLFKGSVNTNVASNGVSCTTNDTPDGLEPVNNCE